MPIQYINTGTSANAGNGDSIRSAFNKVNYNFNFIDGMISGNGTNFDDSVHNVVTPMLVHDVHQNIDVTYDSVLNRIILNSKPFTSTNVIISTLEVSNTSTLVGPVRIGTTSSVEYTNTPLLVETDFDSNSEVVIKNINAGLDASTDLVLKNNQADEVENYIDLGINSSNFDSPAYSVTAPGDGYLFTSGGDLVIGTKSDGKKLRFHAGGTTIDKSVAEFDAYSWRFNRNVQTVVRSAGPLNFTVWNTFNNSASQSLYQAMNDAEQVVKLGIISSNPGAEFGNNIGPSDAFIHIEGSTSTLHIGNSGNIEFWSDEPNGGFRTSSTATLFMSRTDRSSTFGGNILPAEDLTYDLGSATNQWRSLYVGTSTIYLGGFEVSITPSGELLINGQSILGNVVKNNPRVVNAIEQVELLLSDTQAHWVDVYFDTDTSLILGEIGAAIGSVIEIRQVGAGRVNVSSGTVNVVVSSPSGTNNTTNGIGTRIKLVSLGNNAWEFK